MTLFCAPSRLSGLGCQLSWSSSPRDHPCAFQESGWHLQQFVTYTYCIFSEKSWIIHTFDNNTTEYLEKLDGICNNMLIESTISSVEMAWISHNLDQNSCKISCIDHHWTYIWKAIQIIIVTIVMYMMKLNALNIF